MNKSTALFIVLLSFAFALETVPELDVAAYLGEWYEIGTSPAVHLTFERNGFCSRATYTLRDDGKINVLNVQRDGSVDGPVSSIEGYAYQPDPSEPGKLSVHFGVRGKNMRKILFLGAPYWILQLGPIVDGQYQWSIVSEPRKLFAWVLARKPETFKEEYGAEVNDAILNKFGFNKSWNKYRERSREGCVPYEQLIE